MFRHCQPKRRQDEQNGVVVVVHFQAFDVEKRRSNLIQQFRRQEIGLSVPAEAGGDSIEAVDLRDFVLQASLLRDHHLTRGRSYRIWKNQKI